MPARRQTHQRGAHQRPPREVEGALGLLACHPTRLVVARIVGQRGQVHDRKLQGELGVDVLHGLTVPRDEGRPQRLVSAHERMQRGAKGLHVQDAFELQRGGEVVGGAARLELVEEPEPLLSERERNGPVARARAQHEPHRPRAFAASRLNPPGELLNGGRLEEVAQREFHSHHGMDARDELGGEQGVAAEREEAVRRPHVLHAQHLREYLRELLLGP